MKRMLFRLIFALTLSTSVNAEVSDEMHKKCIESRDYEGCVKTNKKLSHKKDKEIFKSLWKPMVIGWQLIELTYQQWRKPLGLHH